MLKELSLKLIKGCNIKYSMLGITACCMTSLWLYHYATALHSIRVHNEDILLDSQIIHNQESNNTMKKQKDNFQILYWTKSYYQYDGDWFGLGNDPFKLCQYSNCIGISDRSRYDSSDVVMFHIPFTHYEMPGYRFIHQKWIMQNWEPPPYSYVNFVRYNGLFNATWSYNTKSDIVSTYGRKKAVKRDIPADEFTKTNYAAGKTKLIAWFVGRCQTQSKREAYAQNLQKHIPVDIYGRCGNLTCNNCEDIMKLHYKFYLSFENSICEDYVTEKLWKAVDRNVIPIVLGGANYRDILPPDSYIDVKDFSTPFHLAQYLLKVDGNDTLYNSYFRWKAFYRFEPDKNTEACVLCKYLNEAKDQVKVYDTIGDMWSEKEMCTPPEQFYSTVQRSAWTVDNMFLSFLKNILL